MAAEQFAGGLYHAQFTIFLELRGTPLTEIRAAPGCRAKIGNDQVRAVGR